MGYATEGLKLLIPGIDSQPNVWTYVSTVHYVQTVTALDVSPFTSIAVKI